MASSRLVACRDLAMGRPKAKAAPRAGKAGVKRKVDDVAESAGCVAKLEHAISKASEMKTSAAEPNLRL